MCLYQWDFTFHNFDAYSSGFFFFIYRSPFNISYKADLVVLNSCSFYLSCKIFSLSFKAEWQPCWVGYLVVGFFMVLNILCHPVLACKVSAEKSTDSSVGVLLYISSCFAAFKIFFLSVLGSLPPVSATPFLVYKMVFCISFYLGKERRWEEEVYCYKNKLKQIRGVLT